MKKDATLSWWGHDEKDWDVWKLIEGAFERPEVVVNWDVRNVEALSNWVWATWKQITKIIENL